MTWFVSVIQRGEWREARLVLRILRDLDPDRSLTDAPLAENLRGLDAIALTERLDESTSEEQAEFLGLSGALGQPALHLVCEVMAHASRTRTRAAACTLLSYLCSDDPRLLAPYLDDSRPQVVRNTVFVLGQIGGPDVAPLLARAAHHPDGQVRRQVIHSLAAVPRDEHVPILLAQLGTRDPQLLAATLNLLARQPDAQVARAIAHYVQAPDFESRSEESQLSLLNALAETAGDEAVPVLQGVLLKGGWFAQRSFARTAAARCLGRLSTPAARAVLEAARHSRSEAVRRAAHEADRREAAA
jgi:HEAT repeat protein